MLALKNTVTNRNCYLIIKNRNCHIKLKVPNIYNEYKRYYKKIITTQCLERIYFFKIF